MSMAQRSELIAKIEELRGSKVICYLTSLRIGVNANMADDAVRVFYDHLLLLPSRPVEKLDVFLVSNGGSGTVPWRLTAVLREFAKSFNVLIPFRAYSAATLLALGADEIVMHPFGEMGPIDPTVSNDFNPIEGGRRLGISVEDVQAYVSFIKDTVGIQHDDELIKAIEILATKVHPLALGNVERFLSQSRLIAKKILKTHMIDTEEHTIDEIIENLASKLYFHGHPINRLEAKEELKLKINTDLPPELESVMWDLYRNYEEEFENNVPFKPGDQLMLEAWPPGAAPAALQNIALPRQIERDLLFATVESGPLASRYVAQKRYLLMGLGPSQEPRISEQTISEGWLHSSGSTVGSTAGSASPDVTEAG